MIKSAIRYSPIPVGVMAAICVVVIGVTSVILMSHAKAAGPESDRDRLITIHDRGEERVILTRAASIKQALDEAGVTLDANDAVEPSLNEELIDKSYFVNIYRARPVVVTDGVVRQKIMTPYQTVDKIVEDAGLSLRDEDLTSLDPTEDIVSEGAGLELKIDRATPFTFILYGKKTEAYTQATTVAAMLKDKKVSLGLNDELSLSADQPITAGMTVELWRNGKQTITEEQAVPFTTEKVQDGAREIGYKEVKTPGVNGKRLVTYEVNIQNGLETSRKEIQSVVQEEPKKQIEIVGTKLTNTFSGSFGEALARLRGCEAGGRYDRNSGNGYYGAYQYNISTWANYGGYRLASDAPPAMQDERAWQTYKSRGWQPWPSCKISQGLQDIYR
jgi:uncharacterized protein YabE (DUF348 family)